LFETGIATGNTQLILVIRIVSVIWLLPVLT